MTVIRVYRNSTHFWTECPPSGLLPNGYHMGDFVKKHLTEHSFNGRLQIWLPTAKFVRYDKDKQRIYLPVNYLKTFMNEVRGRSKYAEFKVVCSRVRKGEKVEMYMANGFEDREKQIDPIKFLSSNKSMKALALQTGCLTQDTIVDYYPLKGKKNSGSLTLKEIWNRFRIDKFLKRKPKTYSLGRFFFRKNSIEGIAYSGEMPVYELYLDNGKKVELTNEHGVKTKEGFKELKDLKPGMKVAYRSRLPWPRYSKILWIKTSGDKPTYDIAMEQPRNNFIANGIVVHNSGKTYCAIKSIVNIGERAIIIASGLLEQWEKEIYEKTSLLPEEIYTVKGGASLIKLYKMSQAGKELPKIILVSTGTLRNYIKRKNKMYKKLPKPYMFFRQLKVGTKVIDEVHLNFHTNVLIDLHLSVYHNIYLSATYQRTSKDGNRIFKQVFPSKMIYGGGDYKKYVNITAYAYHMLIKNPKSIMTNQGYNQYKYEDQMMKDKTTLKEYLDNVLGLPIREKFIELKRADQKALVIASAVTMCKEMTKYLQKEYPKLKTVLYIHETSDEVLDDADIIVSTLGSAGTGTDISKLRNTTLTNSFSAENPLIQALGRLREMEDTPEFCFSYNAAFDAQVRHYEKRRVLYSRLGKTYDEINIHKERKRIWEM